MAMTLFARTLFTISVCLFLTLLLLRIARPDLVVETGTGFSLSIASWFAFLLAFAEWKGLAVAAGSVQTLILISTIAMVIVSDYLLDLSFFRREEYMYPMGIVFALWGIVAVFGWKIAISKAKTRAQNRDRTSAVTAEYLVDPNEDHEAAEYYIKKFRSEGVSDGANLHLVVTVSKIPDEKLAAVSEMVRNLYQCSRIEIDQGGPFIKKKRLKAFLEPIPFTKDTLLSVSRALYRLILDHGVAVEIEKA